ncbi:hypothetical protein [Desulfocurvus sp. DL9XJH121]
MSQERLMIWFPDMHAWPGRGEVPGVLRLDPGIAPDGAGGYRPEGLPLDSATARGWLERARGYAGLFTRPGELLSAYMAGGDDFYSGTAQAIVSELRAMESGGRRDDPDHAEAVRAQCVLLLAYTREQALMEVGGLDSGVEGAWEDMGRSLGLDEEDARELARSAAPGFLPDLDTSPYAAPGDWDPVLEAFLRLLPADAALCLDDEGVAQALRERGVAFAPAGDDAPPQEDPQAWAAARATGYALLGRRVGQDPALLAERLILTR